MDLAKLEYLAKLADAAHSDWQPAPVFPPELGKDQKRVFPWLVDAPAGAYIPTVVADHIAAWNPVSVMELIAEIRKRDALLLRAKEFATVMGNAHYDWTDHAAQSYREVRIENETIADGFAWLSDYAKLIAENG